MSSYDRAMLIQGQYTATPFTLPDGGRFMLPLDVNGNLLVNSIASSSTSGGTLTYSAQGGTGNALLTNTAVAIKASAGNLYGLSFVNLGAVDTYVQLFDLAAGSVVLGTTIPKLVIWVPAGGAWEEKYTDEVKVSFINAISLAATTTTTGSTAPVVGISANIEYK